LLHLLHFRTQNTACLVCKHYVTRKQAVSIVQIPGTHVMHLVPDGIWCIMCQTAMVPDG